MTTLPSGTVTFLLTDVVGSTRLWDSMPRLMPDALALHDEVMRGAVEAHGGVVLKARGEGDSVFAVFRRATDAANAAVAAQHALAVAEWPDGCALSVRMAIHTGEALERDGDYYGPAVNRAARLRAVAGGGQIVVSHSAADLIVDHLGPELRLVELGSQRLRDLERPETVYLLVDADAPALRIAPDERSPQASAGRPPPLPSALSASGPFVGRDEELARLIGGWERVHHGAPRVVMLGGEPGVGKTRLAAEMARRAHEAGAVVLYGRCDEDMGAPYQPFAEALRLLLPSLDAGALRAVRGVEELARLVPEVTDIVPGLPAPTHSDPETERYALFDTVARLFVAVSTDQPVLVVLDDLHWAAKPTLLMLRHVLRFGEGGHVQLLGTYRTTDLDPNHPLSGALADLHRDGIVERLVLAGLDERDVNAFLEAIGHDDDELARTLSTVTSGNPFFLIEVLRHVEETGGRWDPNTLPQGVREAVGRRLSRLTDPTRDALLAGAVAGARFSLELVETVLERDLVDAVEEASAAGILVEEPGGHLRFNHALVRQSLLTGVASVKRLRLHQRIAETLEATGGDSDEHLADLAYHYFESAWAGNAAKAVEYCRRAAEQAMVRLAYEGAAELYERAVQALDVHEVGSRDRDRAELLLARCEAHLAAGDAAGSAAALVDLEGAAGGSLALGAWVVCFQAQLAVLAHPDQLDEMEHRVASAAEEFATLGDAAGEAVAFNTRASCLARLGRFAECELALDRALTAARRSTEGATAADHRRVNAVLAGAPSAALWGPSPVARAGGRCLDVIRLLRITTGSPAVEATSVRCQAMLEAFRGREQAARRMLDSARRNLAELGLRHALLEVDLYEGMVDLLADDVEAAVGHLRRAYEGLSRMGLDADAAEAAALLARACLLSGQEEEADRFCIESERLGGQDLRASIAWRTVRAELLARQGDHDLAREVAEAAVALAEPTDALVDQGDAHLALAVVLHAIGEHGAAATAANEAVVRYERKGASALAERARRLVDSPAAAKAAPPHAERPPNWLVPDAFAAHLVRLNDIWTRRAWDELPTILHADVVMENRRRLRMEPPYGGVTAYTDFLRGIAESGFTRPQLRFLASRGSRLLLVHTLAPIDDTGWSNEVLRILELAPDGRLAADIVFDGHDLDAAHAELDARYLRGEADSHADVFRAVATAIDAYNRRDPAHAALSPDLEAVDHRPAAVVARGGEALIADFEAAIAQLPDSTLRLAAAHVLGDRGAVVTTVLQGTTATGGAVERVFHAVHVVEDAAITRVEIFPESALDTAVLRLGELTIPASVPDVRPNRAVRVFAELHEAYFRGDWATVESVLNDGAAYDDRRPGFQFSFAGRERWVENFQAMAAVGVDRLDRVVVATRGDLLALCRVRGGGTDEDAAAPDVEVLNLMVIDEDGRVRETLVFEPSDREAAFAAMDDRYLAGEGAPYADVFQLNLDYFQARVRDPERSLELVADDVTFIDHRPAGLGLIQGKEEYARVLRPEAASRFEVLTVEGIAHGVVLALVEAQGESTDGANVEWRLHTLCSFRGGLLVRAEAFGPEDAATARAAFDQLCTDAAGAGVAGNTATATWARLQDACAQQDWATLDAVLADDVVSDDRRSGSHLRVTGRTAVTEVARSPALVGTLWFDRTVLATRGDRLALLHTRAGGRERGSGAAEVEVLDLLEVDADGRHLAGVHFDVADLDAAYAELDARYLAGEGAPYASTVGPVLECIRVRASDWDRFVALHAPDVVVFDRRPAAYGVMEGRDSYLDTVEPSWPTDTRVLSIEVADDGVVVTRIRATGRSEHGADIEWLFCILHVVENGLITRLELFETEDAAEATARFEELRRRAEVPVVPDNTATRAFRVYETACGEQDWATVESLVADEVVADDRRSGSHTRFEGRAALVEAMRGVVAIGTTRFHHTTVATRGDRLALIVVLGAGADMGPGTPEMEVLDVVEVDAEGRVAAVVSLDADDVDAAIAELDARYLAREGAPWAETLTPVLEGVRARTRDWDRWVELLAEDVSFVDRRPVGLGVIDGRDAVVGALDPQWDERGHTVAVEAVDHGRVLTLDRAVGASEEGVQVEWLIFVLHVVENGRLRRVEVFPGDDAGTARSRFEQVHAGEEGGHIAGNVATAAWGRHQDACGREDWPAVEALLAEDAVLDDRRAGVHVTAQGRGSVVHVCRTLAAMAAMRFERTTMATRGSRLALIRTRGSGTDQQPEAPALEVLDLVEVDTEGRLVRAVIFDLDDANAAFAELDARYLAGDGAPWAETLAPVLEVVHARTRDRARWVDLLADDISYVDNRLVPAALGVIEGRDAVVGALGPVWNERGRTVAVEAVDHGVVLTLDRTTGAIEEGSQAEWLMYVLRLVERGQLGRVEVFSGDDAAAARARFEELQARAAVPPIAGNVSTDTWGRYHDACAGRDWATVETLLADEVVLDDHRAHLYLQGAAAVAGVARSLAAVGTVRFERTTLATRGSRVALMRTRGSGIDREPGAPALEVLDVVEVDAGGRIVRSVHFDVDEVDAAFAELDARYLAGEGARHAATVAPFLEGVRSRARDWATFASLMSQRIVFVDHRRAGFGVIEGRETFLNQMALPDWAAEHRVLEVEAVDEGAVLALFAARATADNGVEAEWLIHMLNVIEDGLTTRTELFDHNDLPGALARFEELRPRPAGGVIPPNTAAQAIAVFLEACARREWDRAREMGAPNVRMDDLRTGVQLRGIDRRGWIETHRLAIEMGVTRIEPTTVATRGNRLVLSRLWCGTDAVGGAPVVEMLQIVETDERGLIVASIGLDLDDVDTAFAELDRRYLAGEGAPYEVTLRVPLEAVDAAGSDQARWQDMMADTLSMVDHRRVGFGRIEGRGAVVDFLTEDGVRRRRVVAVERLEDGLALVLIKISGESDDGAPVEWLVHQLTLVEGGRCSALELFDIDDFDAALARFDDLRRPQVETIRPNLATQSSAMLYEAAGHEDWGTAEAILAEDVDGPDRRSGIPFGTVGRDAMLEGFRFGFERGATRWDSTTVATRGERLALSKVVIGGDPQRGAPTVEMLQIIETDDTGRITTAGAFNVNDLDGAFAELDRRYVAGEGARHAPTLRVMLDGVPAVAADREKWDALLASDVVLVDHRRVAFGTVEGKASVLELLRLRWATRAHVAAIEKVDDGLVLALVTIVAENADGGRAEWLLHNLAVIRDGLVTRMDLFDLDDLDRALVTFEELWRPRTAENAAAGSVSRLVDACLRRDWEAVGALLAEELVDHDSRSGVRHRSTGRDASVAAWRFGVDQGVTRYDVTTVATRGDRLVLTRVWCGGDGMETPFVEFLWVVETDDDAMIANTRTFDVDDLDAGYAELDARYLAGEGAPHAGILAPVLATSAAWRNGTWHDLLAEDAVLEDHRPASFGVVAGLDAITRLLRRRWPSRAEILAVDDVDGGVALLRTRSTAESPDGAAVEWLAHHVFVVESGLVTRIEVFDLDDDTARRRFEELQTAAAAAVVEPNTAARVLARLYRCLLEQRWSEFEEHTADDMVYDDRRAGLQVSLRGRGEFVESCRIAVDVGFEQGSIKLIATRGDRLVLSWVTTTTGERDLEAFGNLSLVVYEIDASGRQTALVMFGPDDLDAAYAELDARYLAGEGAPHAATLASVLATAEGWRTGRWVHALADDVVFVDHRAAAFGVIEGRESLARLLRAEWTTRVDAVAVDAVDHGVVLFRTTSTGATPDGAAVEWFVRQIHLVENGLVSRVEMFEGDDAEGAHRRFEGLRQEASAAVVEPNTAARVLARSYRCVLEQRWDELDALTADDIVYEDRRPLLQMTARGRREFVESCRIAVDVGFRQGSIELIATRGDRLALTRIVGSAGDSDPGGVENISFGIIEVDESGRSVASVLLDAHDLDAAYAELDARYLAGEGAPYATTLTPVLEARWRKPAEWLDVVAENVVLADHRLASMGTVEGRDAYMTLLQPETPIRIAILAVEAVDHGTVMVQTRVTVASDSPSPDELDAEWLLHHVFVVEDGWVTAVELFEDEALDHARRRYEELRLAAEARRTTDNTAARVQRRLFQHVVDQRGREEEIVADDVVYEDRRAVIRIFLRGRAAYLEQGRLAASLGIRRIDQEVVATRGERLVLSRLTATTAEPRDGGPEIVSLFLNEIDASHRVVGAVGFEADDLDAAFAELDARYLAGEAAPVGDTWTAVADAYRRFNEGQGELRWPAAPVEVTAFADIPGVHARLTGVHRLVEGAALLTVRASAPGLDGWEWLVVLTVSDGRISALETYTVDDLAAALHRFGELASAG